MSWQPRRRANLQESGSDGLDLRASAFDDRVRLYDLATGLQRGGDVPGNPRDLSFGLPLWGFEEDGLSGATIQAGSPDNRIVWTLAAGIARVWDTSLCSLQATATANPRPKPVAPGDSTPERRAVFSPDRRRVVLTWREKHFSVLLDTRTGEPLGPPMRQAFLEHAAFSADGRLLATATRPHADALPVLVLRDGHTGQPIGKPWLAPKLIHALSFSADGKTLAVGAVGGTFLLDLPSLKLRHMLAEASCIAHLLFHPDGRRLATMTKSGWPGVHAGHRVWDIWTGKALGPFHGGDSDAWGPVAAWRSGNGGLVSFRSRKSTLTRFCADGKEVRGGPWPTGSIRLPGFSPDGRRLIAATSIVNVQQWSTRTGEQVGKAMAHPEPARMIRYSGDGKLLAVACEGGAVRLWDAEQGWPLGPPLQHISTPIEMAFAADNHTLLTVTQAGSIHTWPVPEPVQGGTDGPVRFETWMAARGGVRAVGDEAIQLKLEEWQAACRALAERWPVPDPSLIEASDDLADWHRRRARDASEADNDRGELYHLTRLARLQPREPLVHARIAALHARVAARLPQGPAREHQWQLARAAASRGTGRPGEDNWDRLRALDAVACNAREEALWYLDRLVDRHGSDWLLLAERADVHGQRGDRARRDADIQKALRAGGSKQHVFAIKVADQWAGERRWREVATLLGEALAGGPAELPLLQRLALALLKAGDRKGHAALCQSLLRSLHRKVHHDLARAILDLCVLAPRALQDWSAPLQMAENVLLGVTAAEQAAKSEEQNQWRQVRRSWLTTKAALLHRAGQHADGQATLKEALKLSAEGKGEPLQWAWLALIQATSGRKADKDVRSCLDQAKRGLGGDVWDRARLEILLEEGQRSIRRFDEF
jgi:WD40 repeat protein